jgi:hypothetical protein
MSSQHSHADAGAGLVLALVLEPVEPAPGSPLVLELCGPHDVPHTEAVAARLALRHRSFTVSLDTGGEDRHLLRLMPAGEAAPVELTADLLADLLTPPDVDIIPVTGYQREVLLSASAGLGGPGRHVEQLFWTWSGPLDTERFSAAWQSVAAREIVLRASFEWTGEPRLVLHDSAEVEVERHGYAATSWSDLLRQDRARGFVLHRPGLLRVALLDGPRHVRQPGRPLTRVLLSYHRALLDERGALLLLREFYRAYVAGGTVPGGERRPDIRDHASWLGTHGTQAARRYWADAAPPPDAAVSPGRPGRPGALVHAAGPGRIQRRLRPHQTARLRAWAALRGAGESSALHLVWALLLHRASGAHGAAPVSFGVHFSGRDLTLRDAAVIPGLLGNTLPMTVTVDPAASVGELLRQVRDTALDLTTYAWVPGDRVREWSGRGDESRLTDTLVRFESLPELPESVLSELTALGVDVDVPRGAGGDTSLPVTLAAQHDDADGLLLTATYDRAELPDKDASRTLSQCMHLLRALADRRDEEITVGGMLALLDRDEVPQVARAGRMARGSALAVLRPGEPQADVICLVSVPGVVPGTYEALVREHEGPERIVSLGLGAAGEEPPSALAELLGTGGRLVLCGSGPAGWAAYEIARGQMAAAAPARTVIMTGTGDAEASARALASALESVRARHM